MLTYLQVSLKLLFAYKLSYKKSKSVKHRVIGSFFRGHQFVKSRGEQICTTPIWIGLNEFDNSYAQLWRGSFFRNYYCWKWYQKHWICNWLVKENKFGAATFWVRYLFLSLYLFSGTFFRDLLERISLAVLQIATAFLNFRELRRPLPCGRVPSQPLSMFRYCVCAIRTHHKNKQ